jgi:hypothetical protein
MVIPDTAPPAITEYYYGGAVSGWNAGEWDERVIAPSAPFSHLHNFAPIRINDSGTNLTFTLCGNGFYNGPNPQNATLYADVLIADCSQFTESTASGVEYHQILSGSTANISEVGTVCFEFTTTYSIPTSCDYHAAVAFILFVPFGGDSERFDFSYQLKVTQ